MTDAGNRRTGWTSSIAIHLLLLLFFILWKMQIQPFLLDFTPVNFAPLMTVDKSSASALAALESGVPLVELPRRPMLDDTSPLLQLPDRARPPVEAVIPRDRPEDARRDLPSAGRRTLIPTAQAGRSDRPAATPMPVNDSWLEGEQRQAMSGKLTGDEMFTISWDGPSRLKVSGTLPEYPPGVNRDATVKLAFDVAPDGAVTFVSPNTKGVPELEMASINSLKTWRFNTLDPSQPQIKQRGEITFVFRLK